MKAAQPIHRFTRAENLFTVSAFLLAFALLLSAL